MTLLERFRRWRASRGYGLHSPLAFRIAKNVLRPPSNTIYYGEERLENLAAKNNESKKLLGKAKILLRLVAELQPAYVWTSPGLPPLMLEAVRLAGCVVRIYEGDLYPDDIFKADLVVYYKAKPTKPVLRKILKPGKGVVGFSLLPSIIDKISTSFSGGGIVIEGIESVIAVATADPYLNLYKVARF